MTNEQAGMSRRDVLGVAAGAAALGAMGSALAGTRVAVADEGRPQTFADTVAWDAEYDVVVVGMGFAGMTAAMAAADAGASVLIAEKASQGTAGGNSRVCGQGFSWAHGDADGAYTYYKALTAGRDVPDDMVRTLAEGVARTGEILAGYGFDPAEYHDATMAVICPEYPEFEGSENFTQSYVHETTGDAYIYQTLKDRIAQVYAGSIDVWYESPAVKLIQDPASKIIVGVQVSRNGELRNVRALNGVVMACGGYEANREMVQQYLGVINYAVMGSFDNTGDGHRMCQEVGARMWHMSVYEGGFSLCGCSYYYDDDQLAPYSVAPGYETAMTEGATIVVGTWGRRFGDESFWPRHGHMDGGNGIWENPHYPDKIWVLWDKTQMDLINEAGVFNEDFRDTVIECATLDDVAAATGMKPEILAKTVADFNTYAQTGDDLEFRRPPETMRAYDGEGYFVMPLKNLMLNTQGGAERNVKCEVIGLDGEPIPHLYSAGEFGALTACMYQSGTNTSECYVFGPIAGVNAAAPKDDLPALQMPVRVASDPAHVGEENDVAVE